MKDNDPLKMTSEIKFIFHDIKSISVEVDLQLTAFIKVLHLVYSYYLESLPASR